MITENLSTLKIHTLSEEQFKKAKAEGTLNENEIYLTPDEEIDLNLYAKTEDLSEVAKSGSFNDLTDQPILGELASKDEVAKTDLDTNVQASLDKADTALQSYTETDPTVPAWAKESTKPRYTADEVGALSNTTVLADLTQDDDHRTVTDTEKSTWNAKATTGYVDQKVADLVDSSPETLNTLNELAAALGDDPNFATTVAEEIGKKVDKVEGKGLSTNDYTSEEKNKLASIAAGAEVNVQGDWNQSSTTADDYIKNKIPITNGDGESSIVIMTGDANGKHAIAGGSTDKALVTELIGELGNLANLTPAQANGTMSMAFGANATAQTPASMAFGYNVTAGVCGYYWDAIDFTKKTIQLSTTRRVSTLLKPSYPSTVDWAVGDKISIINESHYAYCSTITAVSGNVITVDTLPFESIAYEATISVFTYTTPQERSVFNVTQPTKGVVELGFGAMAFGGSADENTRALGMLSYARGYNTIAAGDFGSAIGRGSIAGYAADASGYYTVANGEMAHAEGKFTVASNAGSHAEGYTTTASGRYAHAQGINTTSSGRASHSEGEGTLASGDHAHAQGKDTVASGAESFAHGGATTAVGDKSEAGGIRTTAYGQAATSEGYSATKALETLDGVTLTAGDEASIAAITEKWNNSKFNLALGNSSHTEGSDTIALSNYAHAEGNQNIASGQGSHAENYGNTASGRYAHAEGVRTTSSGRASHTEGEGTVASNEQAHAEGISTTASGKGAHSEGCQTVASGESSHAEGDRSTANGDASHAEGEFSVTGGDYTKNTLTAGTSTRAGSYAHAEGNATIATGVGAHSEGQKTFASGKASHAEGCQTIASGQNSHTEGYNTLAEGSYAHAEGDGYKYACIVFEDGIEQEKNCQGNAKGRASHAEGGITLAKGDYSHAEGKSYVEEAVGGIIFQQTEARGIGSHAEGLGTLAIGDYSHAEGGLGSVDDVEGDWYRRRTKAEGEMSHAEGRGTWAIGRASHAEGEETEASGDRAHAEGYITTAKAWASHAEGAITTAKGYYSHSEGYQTISEGSGSHAEGSGTTAKGDYAHAEGFIAEAIGASSHAEGSETKATGDSAHTEGIGSDARGQASHAEGFMSVTGGDYTANTLTDGTDTGSGAYAHAEGNATIATGAGSHSEGKRTFASGVGAHAEGISTYATNSAAHAEGSHTQANANSAHAEGRNTIANNSYSHAEGYFTETNASSAHAEGYYCKVGGSYTSNTLTVGTNNNSGSYAHAEGNATIAMGVGSHSEGENTFARGTASHAEGMSTEAVGGYAHAEGYATTASGFASHAECANTQAISANAHSEGYHTIAGNGEFTSNTLNDPIWDDIGVSAHAEGTATIAQGEASHAEGYLTFANGKASHAEGWYSSAGGDYTSNTLEADTHNTDSGAYAHAEGNATIATGVGAHSEGTKTFAQGEASHAEGWYSSANGMSSHAEGHENTAHGAGSHAEGLYTHANGDYSHAEGVITRTFAEASHAEGYDTKAYSLATHSEGKKTEAGCRGYYITAIDLDHNNLDGIRIFLSDVQNNTPYIGSRISFEDDPFAMYVDDNFTTPAYQESYGTDDGDEFYGDRFTINDGTTTYANIGCAYLCNKNIIYLDSSYNRDFPFTEFTERIDDLSFIIYSKDNPSIGTVEIGKYAHVGGDQSQAMGQSSFVHGTGLFASGKNQAVFGQYNADTDAIFAIGTGRTDYYRYNGFEVYPNGIGIPYSVDYETRGMFRLDGDKIEDLENRITFLENQLGVCLLEGTKITMADGTEKNIEDVQAGDMIQSWDIDNNCMYSVPALASVHTGFAENFTAYTFEQGQCLTIFDPHHIYSVKARRPKIAQDFQIGEKVINTSGEEILYTGSMKRHFTERKKRYTLLSANNLYFAGGILCGHQANAKDKFVKLGHIHPNTEEAALYIEDAAVYNLRLEEKFNPDYLAESCVLRGKYLRQKELIDKLKSHLADSDYKALKFFEGLITEEEWNETRIQRAEWRERINTKEAQVAEIQAQYEAVKDKYLTRKTVQECFDECYKRDMEFLRSHTKDS